MLLISVNNGCHLQLYEPVLMYQRLTLCIFIATVIFLSVQKQKVRICICADVL